MSTIFLFFIHFCLSFVIFRAKKAKENTYLRMNCVDRNDQEGGHETQNQNNHNNNNNKRRKKSLKQRTCELKYIANDDKSVLPSHNLKIE